MVSRKREPSAARSEREYPTEWTLYPSDDEGGERFKQLNGIAGAVVKQIDAPKPGTSGEDDGARRSFNE
jgi:hypothetical protein